jgi:hypothetical protein
MATQLIFLLIIAAGMFLLGAIAGHKLGRRTRRHDYPDGWDAGVEAERERWEKITGGTYERIAAETGGTRVPDVPGPDGWPYGFTVPDEPPPTDVLMAEAVRQGYTGPQPAVPSAAVLSAAEADEWKARWEAAQERPAILHVEGDLTQEMADALRARYRNPPIVADITDAANWYPHDADAPTLTGVLHAPGAMLPDEPGRTGPEWLACQLAAMDAKADAIIAEMEAECRSFRLGITAGSTPAEVTA